MMTTAIESLGRPLSRPVMIFVLPPVFLILVLFFVYWGFPYDRIADGITTQVESATDMQIDIAELGPHLSLLGPGLEARGVRARPRNGDPIDLDRVRMRPAWSFAWLRGDPAFHLDVASPMGRAIGAVTLGEERGFDGSVEDLDLSSPALQGALPVEGLAGTLSLDADLVIGAEGPLGTADLVVSDGSLSVPGSPIAIPFDQIDGNLVFGEGGRLTVETLTMEGPMLNADATGTVGAGGRGGLNSAPLDLEVNLQVQGQVARSALRGAGIRLDRDGKAAVSVGGSVGSPRVR